MSGSSDEWASLAPAFVDDAYQSAKGHVRTYVLHRQLLAHLPPPPAAVLDVGGGAGHQSLPLARRGHPVTLLDPSAAMLSRAEERVAAEDPEVRARVALLQARGEDAPEVTAGQRFGAVLCHGVLMYLPRPDELVAAVAACAAPGGIVSLMALNGATMAVRPALEGRWAAALAAFEGREEEGVLGVHTRADTVEGLSEVLRRWAVEPLAWYGVWLFADWTSLPEPGTAELATAAAVELEASRRDPYRAMSRVFHLVGRRTGDGRPGP